MTKMLDKVSKLLAKAENAGTPEEAAAFMAKAQELATINAIDLAVARQHQAKREKVQEPEERRISVNPHNRRHNRKHFMDLALAISRVNDCENLISGREISLIAVGFPEDLDVVEALYTHLSVQMVAECDEALKRGEHKAIERVAKTIKIELAEEDRQWGDWDGKARYYDDEPADGPDDLMPSTDRWGNRIYRKPYPPPTYREEFVLDDDGKRIYEEKEVSAVDGRVFRSAFYEAFVLRMEARLREIKASTQREQGALEESSSTAIALRDKKAEVQKADEERRAKLYRLGEYTSAGEDENRKYDHTGTGHRAGRVAAETVPVHEGRAVKK